MGWWIRTQQHISQAVQASLYYSESRAKSPLNMQLLNWCLRAAEQGEHDIQPHLF